MTDLQKILFIIGGVIVVGVIVYNKWQENKARRTLEQAFPSSHDDVLMTSDAHGSEAGGNGGGINQRQEPSIYSAPMTQADNDDDPYGGDTYTPSQARQQAAPSAQTPQAPHRSEAPASGFAAAAAEFAPEVQTGFDSLPEEPPFATLITASQKELPVDDLIDATIPIALEAQVRGEKILPSIQNLRYVGNKPVHFIGHHINGDWEPIAHGGVYQSLLVGVQLANRSNPLSELEYSELLMRLRQFTDTINAEPDIPDMADIINIAQSLHQFIVDHDVQLGVNVQSNGAPWEVNTLVSALTRQGFDLRTDGTLVMQDGEGEVLFSLSTNVPQAAETTDRLTLLLDVPRVSLARDGYGALVSCARSLAMRLGGKVVDDSNQPLSEAALSDIAEQVSAFYAAMASAEIPAGSSRAMRLFS
ncbi:MAG TPA: cell division protein ZipA C-terminal FtsZ-binding domain-containing protein [Herbaspirillum sp.]|jgi:FtsZ-interacting cell division protein ZipA